MEHTLDYNRGKLQTTKQTHIGSSSIILDPAKLNRCMRTWFIIHTPTIPQKSRLFK